jgi:hypothetical protein
MPIIGFPDAESGDECVVILTHGVPYMAPNEVVRPLPRRASWVNGRNMSRGRSEEQFLVPGKVFVCGFLELRLTRGDVTKF